MKRPKSDSQRQEAPWGARRCALLSKGRGWVASCRPRRSRGPRRSSAVCPACGQGATRPGHLRHVGFRCPGRQPPTAPRTVVGPISPSSQPQPLWPGLARARGLSGGHGDPVWLSDRGPCSWAGAQFKGAPAASACPVASEAPPSTPSAFRSLRSPSGRVHTPPRRAEVSAVQAPGTACPCAAEVNPHPEQSRHDL